jgi:GNAT superfamily N-acetyltransferase
MPAPAIAAAAIAATTAPRPGVTVEEARTKAANRASSASPSAAAATRGKSDRASARENVRMAAVSQALIAFANHFRPAGEPGVEIIETPRYRITLQPDFPIPGPNSVSWIRCRSEEADQLIGEVQALVAPRHLPIMWTLDPQAEPADFRDHLAEHGVLPDPHGPEVEVMVLPISATIESPRVDGLEMRDALADAASFRTADAVNSEAFDAPRSGDEAARLERRRQNQLAAGNRRVILASVGGEPAGSAGLTLYPPHGAILNGGAVRPKFRGRGVYRTMVAARLDMARDAGVEGLSVWGGAMSAPILSRLGFEKVGWRRFYLDTSAI